MSNIKFNGLVKSLKRLFSVIPAPYQVRGKLQQESSLLARYVFRIYLDSRFHGNDNFLRVHQHLILELWHLPALGMDFQSHDHPQPHSKTVWK